MNAQDKRCTKCGEEKPATFEFFPPNKKVKSGLSPWCRVCKRADGKRHYKENVDVIRAQHREYQQKHPEVFRVSAARFRLCHPEKARAATDKWMAENREQVLQAYRDYDKRRTPEQKAQRREKAKLWPVLNKEAHRVLQHGYRARRRSLPSDFTANQWQHAINYFNGCCAVCGRQAGLWHKIVMDHWIPLKSADCPGTVVSNIVPLCHGVGGCNNSKRELLAIDWLTKKFGDRKAEEINKRIQAYFTEVENG